MKVLNTVFLILILPFSVYAKVSLKDFEYLPGKETGKIKIRFKGQLGKEPIFSIKKNLLQVEIYDSHVWPRVEKRVSIGNPGFDTKMMMYQYDKDTVRFRVLFPFPTAELQNNFKLKKQNKHIILEFPTRRTPAKVVKEEKAVKELDEEYLKKLLTETKPAVKTDEVKMGLSAIKKGGSDFSLTPYIGKFSAFLGIVLLMFFGVVTLFKKGMAKKGKLGFLNKMKPVEVLDTTYLGPKKSLLLIKAHNQILLLGSSETGINFLTEVEDSTNLMKQGEAHVLGKNFDTTLEKEDGKEKDFKLKDAEENSLEKLLGENKEEKKEKISDQIKKKIQNLKSLQ